MDEVIPKNQKRNRDFKRVQLTEENCEKLQNWLDQISNKLNGVMVSKNAMINWIVSPVPAELSGLVLTKLKKDFFDEVAYAHWVLEEVKRRKKSGEQLDFRSLINPSKMKPGGRIKVRAKKPSSEVS